MKIFYRILSAAAFSAMFMACSIDEPYTNENGLSSLIRVAEFPAYGAGTKAVGTADEGKHSWDRNDVILLAIGDQKTGISYLGSGIWEFTTAVTLSGSAEVTAYYAPDYEWSGDALALKEGASAGLDEFLTYTYEDADLSDGIDIVFSGDRSYSRLRVASVPGASVSLSGAFIPVNAETAIGQTAVSTVTDANGNAFFYGTWEDQANLKFSVGSSDFDKILSASVGNRSYVLRAGGYSYDAESDTYRIADAAGLAAFTAAIAGNPDVNAELYDDITLTAEEGTAAWSTITSDYAGTFDGRGFSIKGLDAPFAASVSGTVQNVKFIGVNIAADGTENCGAVTKYLTGSILNTAVTGTITTSANGSGDPGLGGLVGQADGKALIDNCYSNIDIWTQTGFITGGIVGVIKDSDGINILNCTAEGDIQRTEDQVPNNVGGILGRKTRDGNTSDNYIKGCLVTSTIQVNGAQNVGGIMGSIQSSKGVKIENCSVSMCAKLYDEIKSIGGVKISHVTGIDGVEGACDAFRLINENTKAASTVFPFKRKFSKYDLSLVAGCNRIQSEGGFIKKMHLKLLDPFLADKSQKGRMLLDTLETFVLDAGMNGSKTSEIMEIHANTVQYRLKKINEMLGVEITGNRVIPGLTVALALNRLEKRDDERRTR